MMRLHSDAAISTGFCRVSPDTPAGIEGIVHDNAAMPSNIEASGQRLSRAGSELLAEDSPPQLHAITLQA